MEKRITGLLCIVAAMGLVAAASGQEAGRDVKTREVTVVGQGMDKKEAQSDALRKAVEEGAGAYIHSESEARDFTLVRDTILTRAAGFVLEKKVLSEKELDDGTWQVKITAVVSVSSIEATWGTVKILLKEKGYPKIMVFVNEKVTGPNRRVEVVEDSTVQTRIENLLLKYGFVLVDKNQLKDIDRKDLAAAVAEDSAARVQAVAKRFGAQIFITGSANSVPGDPKVISGIKVFPYEAEANIKCYQSDDARLLSSIPGVSTRGVQQVWRSAAKQALDLQARQIAAGTVKDVLRFWVDVLQGGGAIQLHVEGLDFARYRQLKKDLETVKGVDDVSGEFHNGVAELTLQCKDNAEKLAENLSDTVKGLEITDVSSNVIKGRMKAENK